MNMHDTANHIVENALAEPKENAKIELLTGEKALLALNHPILQAAWDKLYQACEWATIFQSPDYITTWYRHYQTECLPVLITSYHGDTLTGILNLCILRNKEITGTGGEEAYYHTWLAQEFNKISFIRAALLKIKQHLPKHNVRLYQLPPHTPIDWLSSDVDWNKSSVLIPYERPLVDLTHPELPKLFTKKQFKENRNRLKRLGELTYQKITDPAAFNLIMDELAEQYDFRKGATLNLSPFRNDPHKKAFYLELFEQGLLHVTILRLNKEIVAALVATIGKNNWVHGAGINTHAPTYAHFSPGFISFIMLAQQLSTEQFKLLDLSTGDQCYKARMANAHDKVYELLIFNQAPSKIKLPAPVKQLCISALSSAGVNYKALRSNLKRRKVLAKEKWHLLKNQGLSASMLISLLPGSKAASTIPHQITLLQSQTASPLIVQRNSIKDLLAYTPQGSLTTRWEFLEAAMRRYETGEQSYTWSEGGVLLACVWLKNPFTKPRENDTVSMLPDGTCVLHELYHHPSAVRKLPDFLQHVAAAVRNPGKPGEVYLLARNRDAKLAGVSNPIKKVEHVLYPHGQLV